MHHSFYSANFTARSTGFCRLLTVVAVEGFVLKQWHYEFLSLGLGFSKKTSYYTKYSIMPVNANVLSSIFLIIFNRSTTHSLSRIAKLDLLLKKIACVMNKYANC